MIVTSSSVTFGVRSMAATFRWTKSWRAASFSAVDRSRCACLIVRALTPPVPSLRPRVASALCHASLVQVSPGYLNVVQARARKYSHQTGALLAPFGFDIPGAAQAIAQAALSIGIQPDEVWCAGGSGVLARGLAQAWPNASRHVVQVGRALSANDVAGATIHVYPKPFKWATKNEPPFPSDPHYDAKAWELCLAHKGSRRVLFWNVTGPAEP